MKYELVEHKDVNYTNMELCKVHIGNVFFSLYFYINNTV